ncbi:hypothetical protein DNTS_015087 [Danionella cerebrum]|uniref:Uncharacterized protein n=1 Tax=Danionella cerebrum TaxID=2873325 RepID=A0A553QQA0_9TELE|nr:hypothetical protein DNTS_015087 [Danionella translucida]
MRSKYLLSLGLLFAVAENLTMQEGCPVGFKTKKKNCLDEDECSYIPSICGKNTQCFNTVGSYYCRCEAGFSTDIKELVNFTQETRATCKDINECLNADCGVNAQCKNTEGSFYCTCKEGYSNGHENMTFTTGQGVECIDRNECEDPGYCGPNAQCHNIPGDSYCICTPGFTLKTGETNFTGNYLGCESVCVLDPSICGTGECQISKDGYECVCKSGFTNYGLQQSKCAELNCDTFITSESPSFEAFLMAIDDLLSKVTKMDIHTTSKTFHLVESMLKMIGPILSKNQTRSSSAKTEVEFLVERGPSPPQGSFLMSTEGVLFASNWDTATGNEYLGFTTTALLSYKGLEELLLPYFNHIETQKNQTFKINSKVVTVAVSNKDTAQLEKPVNLTFSHLKRGNEEHTCVFWDVDLGAWSTRGCTTVYSSDVETLCSCSHLSSFAVLMALYNIGDVYELQVISRVGLTLSLVCLLVCIITFLSVRSIQSTRTTIHLHLSISLFIAYFIFLVGISRTENPVGCAVVAGILHYFFLASFCWMCLEGVQLFRMVVLVFHTTLRNIHMFGVGYGLPAVIVVVSASVNASGYGTENYCWLKLKDGFIWSFYGPVCVIIIVNVIFFLITIWKLAEKFSTLNPDLDNLRKIKAFVVTAIAQLCVLGIMWVFGCFQFDQNSLAISYIFSVLGSLQGVREEYVKFFSCKHAPLKRKYSEFSSNQSKPQVNN